MQREIKFRAWDIESKHYTKDEFLISGCYKNEIQVLGISTDKEAECMNDEVVLEQYTGLCDDKGREIYEGDIISFENSMIPFRIKSSIVVWDDAMFSAKVTMIDQSLPIYALTNINVIGNIHEHPELLNG